MESAKCSATALATCPSELSARSIHITEGDHPYVKNWWVPGHQIGYEHTFIHQAADFLQDLSEGKIPGPTFRDGLATDYVTDAVLRSAHSGRWEKVAA